MRLSLRSHRLSAMLINFVLIFTPVLSMQCYAGLAETDTLSILGIQRFREKIPAPKFSLPDLDGKMVTLDQYRGKALMVYFWTTY